MVLHEYIINYYYYHPRMRCGNAFDRVCLRVCRVRAQSFESLEQETSLPRCVETFSEYLAQFRISRSWGRRSSQEQVSVLFAGGLPSTESNVIIIIVIVILILIILIIITVLLLL